MRILHLCQYGRNKTDTGYQMGECEMYWYGTPYKDNRKNNDNRSTLSPTECGNNSGKIYETGERALGNRKPSTLGS